MPASLPSLPKHGKSHLLVAVPLVVTASVTVAMSGLVTACAVQWLRTMGLERKVLRRMLAQEQPPLPPLHGQPPREHPHGHPHREEPLPPHEKPARPVVWPRPVGPRP